MLASKASNYSPDIDEAAANVPLDNTAGPRIVNVEVRSTAMVGQPAQEVEVKETRRATLAKTPEVMGYDGDGNLVSDGLWAYAWDAQNRLQWAVRQAGTAGAGDATLVHYAYDHLGRRVGKIVYVSGAAMPLVKSKTIYFYDGWNLIYETKITPGNGAVPDTRLTRQYTWGLDMSGTPQGAGGVGGLVGVSLVEAIRDAPGLDAAHLGWRILQDTSLVPAYDGNGNIVAYRNAGTGAVEQEEEYGPFGESLRPRLESALRSPFGWSTKYTDEETGLVYYGHRYYSPSLARWLSKDPIAEDGGVNLYGMVGNDPVSSVDVLGLSWKVERKNKQRAIAKASNENDTFDALGRILHMDMSDYNTWAKTRDEQPNICKEYSIPNTIYIDFGDRKLADYFPHSIMAINRAQAKRDKDKWESKGFKVRLSKGNTISGSEITQHLSDQNLYGYEFVGHGADGIINTYAKGETDGNPDATPPGRYTKHGIAFLSLKACESATRIFHYKKTYKFNSWESNVAKRGNFFGYSGGGDTNTLNEFFNWRTTTGHNDQPN